MEPQPPTDIESNVQDSPDVTTNQAGVDELTALPGIEPALPYLETAQAPGEESPPALPFEEVPPEEEIPEELLEEQAPPPEPPQLTSPPPTAREAAPRRSSAWIWPSLLGAVLGGFLGLILTVLLFAGINGSIDVGRSRGFRTLAGQVNGLGVEVDALRDDTSALQGDLSGLRQRVEVLSGLTARMEQAEATLGTFTGAIRALQQETDALQTSLDGLEQEVSTLEEAVDAVEAQTEKTMSFFDRLRTLLDDSFATPEAVDK